MSKSQSYTQNAAELWLWAKNIVNKDCRGEPEHQLKVCAESLMKCTLGNISATNPFPPLLFDWFFFNANLIVEIPNLKCFTCWRGPWFFSSSTVWSCFPPLPHLAALPYLPHPSSCFSSWRNCHFQNEVRCLAFRPMALLLALPESPCWHLWPCSLLEDWA